MGRRVELPLTVLVLLVLALGVVAAQGWRMARDRFERLQPSRAALWLDASAGEQAFDVSSGPRFLVADLGDAAAEARVGLYQVFPERTLVRWIEPAPPARGHWLVIPLEGLQTGDYLLARAPAGVVAAPREMDRPAEELAVIGRFRLDSR